MWYDELIGLVTSDVFCTVIGGVLVFVISQWILELVIKPKVEYMRTVAKITYALNYYADVINNPMIIEKEKREEAFKFFIDSKYGQASEELRKLGCEIITFTFKSERNEHISKELIYLSNSMWVYSGSELTTENRNSTHLRGLLEYIQNKKTKKQKKKK